MIEVSYSFVQIMLLGITCTSLLCALIVWSMHKKVSWIVYPWPYIFWGGSSKKRACQVNGSDHVSPVVQNENHKHFFYI